MNILVTGASGYIGGKLVPRLEALGHQVTCLVRNPDGLAGRRWENVRIQQADLLDPASLPPVMKDIEVAYYLVHSMANGVAGNLERDLPAARNLAAAAREAGGQGILYLG